MDKLVKIYENDRINKNEPIYDVIYLEELFNKDNKKLLFIVFYWYLVKADIPLEVSNSELISLVVFSLNNSIKDVELNEYYSKYFDIKENEIQWKNIYNEINIIKIKEELNKIIIKE